MDMWWVQKFNIQGETPPTSTNLRALQITYNNEEESIFEGTYSVGGEAPIKSEFLEIDGDAFNVARSSEGVLELDEKVDDKERIKLARAGILCEQEKEAEALEIYESFEKGSRFYRQILHKKADIKLTLGRIEESHADLLELLDTNIMVAVQLIGPPRNIC